MSLKYDGLEETSTSETFFSQSYFPFANFLFHFREFSKISRYSFQAIVLGFLKGSSSLGR